MGKKIREEDILMNIIINGDRGKKEMGALNRLIKDTRSELTLLENKEKVLRLANKTNTAEYRKLTAAIEAKNAAISASKQRMQELAKSMDITKMSAADLTKELNRLKKLAAIATPGSRNRQNFTAQIVATKNRIAELNAETQVTAQTLQTMGTRFQRFIGSMVSGFTIMFAAISGVRKATDDFIEFDDTLADVRKTTDLTDQEVRQLSDDLDGIDTRTTQIDMLGLARVAGKLGIEGRDNILGFVDAADKINVSLAEDLGGDVEKAINTVGKLVDVFDIDNEFGIETAMLKVGSVINDLGKESAASEEEIVDFLSRLAGIGPSAKISISNIAGIGSTLSQLNQRMEVAGTTFVNLIPKMFTDTEKFARIAGMGLQEFTDLLNTDANEALIRLLEGLKGNNEGMKYMMKYLSELGLEGARAKNILSVMANNTAKLRLEQQIANDAFNKGTSILDEFNIKNNNAAASLDKAKKEVTKMWVELGQKLYPAIIESTTLFAKFLGIISALIDFFKKYNVAIISATSAVVAYNAVVMVSNSALLKNRNVTLLASAAQSLLTGNITKARRAMQLMNLTMKFNVWGIALAAVVALGTAIYLYTRRTKEAYSATEEFAKMQKKANDQAAADEAQVKSLLKVARDKSVSDEIRNQAIRDLIALNPQMLSGLSLEVINTDAAKQSVDRYIQAKKDQYLIDELVANNQELLAKKQGINDEINTQSGRITKTEGTRAAPSVRKAANSIIADKKKELAEIQKLEEANAAQIEEIYKRQATERLRQEAEAEAERNRLLRQQQAKDAEEIKQKEIDAMRKYREQVLHEAKSLYDQEVADHTQRLKSAGLYGKKREDMTKRDLAVLTALELKHATNVAKIDTDALTDEISRRETAYKTEISELKIRHNAQLAAFIGTKEQRKALIQQQHIEEAALMQQQSKELLDMLTLTLSGQQLIGIQADDILSDSEKAALEAKIEELRLKLSELGLGQQKSDSENTPHLSDQANRDILGFTADQWESFLMNLDQGADGIDKMYFAATALINAWQLYNNAVSASERAQLQDFERTTNQKKKTLDRQLKAGLISQDKYNSDVADLEADLEVKRAEMAYNQAKRQKEVALMSAIVNTAAGIARAFADYMFPASAIIGGIVGVAGALQIAAIAKEPLPDIPGREDGGFIDVTRSQDRKMFRARYEPGRRGYVDTPTIITGEAGTEMVASHQAYLNPTIRPVLDAIDTAQRNGTISTLNLMKVFQDRPPMRLPGREAGGYIYDDQQVPPAAQAQQQSTDRVESLLEDMLTATRALNAHLDQGIEANVSLLGPKGFNAAQAQYSDLQRQTNI